MKFIFSVICCLYSTILLAQSAIDLNPFNNNKEGKRESRKLHQRNHGAIIGIQRGGGFSFEMGYEAHWRKISLKKPNIVGATANMEYDFVHNVVGYKAGMWMKGGRVNLTYGGNLLYFTDMKGASKYGVGPSVGFRLAGFHFVNGVNLLAGDKDLKANLVHVALRYYFPVHNKFTWDRKTMKRREERRDAREERKKQREEERKDKTGIKKLLNL